MAKRAARCGVRAGEVDGQSQCCRMHSGNGHVLWQSKTCREYVMSSAFINEILPPKELEIQFIDGSI